MRNTAGGALVILGFSLAACAGDEPEEAGRRGEALAHPEPLTDAGIVTLVTHVNGAEIGSSRAAFPKLQNAAVRAYAELLIADHLRLEHAVDSVDVKADTAQYPPPQFATMQAVTHAQSAAINTIPPGPAFDRTFVAFQVLNHTMAVDSLRRWHRAARDDGVKRAIAASLPRIEAHLARAQGLQAQLGGSMDSGTVAPPPPDTSWAQRTRPDDTVATAPVRVDTILRRAPSPPGTDSSAARRP